MPLNFTQQEDYLIINIPHNYKVKKEYFRHLSVAHFNNKYTPKQLANRYHYLVHRRPKRSPNKPLFYATTELPIKKVSLLRRIINWFCK